MTLADWLTVAAIIFVLALPAALMLAANREVYVCVGYCLKGVAK